MKKITIIIVILLGMAATAFALDPDNDAMKPDSHRAGWATGHQQAAKTDAASCNGCHKKFFCIDCHQRRDTVTERVHKRNFKFYHSIEARTNPKKCDTCHKITFCTDCHANPK
ncbi:MAG: hypothetical protein HYY43_06480 [Deltaproteobacteria bacterium]|nr:hypothetical protein [Deltaproteobacteria bacterium]